MITVSKKKVVAAFTPMSSSGGMDLSMEPIYDSYTRTYTDGFLAQGKRFAGEREVYHHHLSGDLDFVSTLQIVSLPTVFYPWNEAWEKFRPSPTLYLLGYDHKPSISLGNYFIPWNGSSLWEYKFPNGTRYTWGGAHKAYCSIIKDGDSVVVLHWDANFIGTRAYYDTMAVDADESAVNRLLERYVTTGGMGKPETAITHVYRVFPVFDVDLHEGGFPPSIIPSMNIGLPDVGDLSVEWDEIFRSAVDSASLLDINGISFIKDIIEWRKLLPPIRDLRRLRKDPKAWANLYLYLRYGLSLTLKDSKEVITKFLLPLKSMIIAPKKRVNRVRYGKQLTLTDKKDTSRTWRVSIRGRIAYDPWPGEYRAGWDNVEALRSLDLFPTAENLWDLIPYSFVLDWFIPVSDWLSRIDTECRVWSYTIYSVTTSSKLERDVPLPCLPGYTTSGFLTETFYSRGVSNTLPILPTSWMNKERSGSPQRAIDAAALLAQRIG